MNAIEENQFVRGFRAMAATLPRPQSILCVSAHWYTRGTQVTAMDAPRTIHDFGGFPKELFEVRYPAKGNPALAKEAKEILRPTEVALDQHWGIDHGAWSVIKHLYPDADIPVVQLSLDATKPAQYHFELSQRLGSFTERLTKGVNYPKTRSVGRRPSNKAGQMVLKNTSLTEQLTKGVNYPKTRSAGRRPSNKAGQ